MCSISTNIITVLANFLGIQNLILSKNIGRNRGNTITINWALNVFPLLWPGLLAVYAKPVGKEHDLATIRVNAAVAHELAWVVCRLESSTGMYMLKSVEWDPMMYLQ